MTRSRTGWVIAALLIAFSFASSFSRDSKALIVWFFLFC